MKVCSKCKQEKPDNRFYRSTCKDCRAKDQRLYNKKDPEKTRKLRRSSYLRYSYGLSQDDVDALLESQNGKCMGCGRNPTDIDHDHLTGKVRGMLCRSCNLILGHVKDDPIVLEALARYLRGI